MLQICRTLRFAAFLAVAVMVGCGQSPTKNDGQSTNPRDFQYPLKAGKYTILGILTDDKNEPKAKSNAEDALTANPDIKVMVGLWAYNPPMIHSALKAAGKLGEVKIVGFDENAVTLQGIKDGDIHGTVVQQPFVFGFKSVELLAAMQRGETVKFKDDKLYIPTKVIKRDNVDAFNEEIENIKAGKGAPPEPQFAKQDTSKPVKVAFLTNSVDDFWRLAEEGCKLGEKAFGAKCTVYMPTNLTVGQKQAIEQFITEKYDGLAISVIDPKGQADLINSACDKMNVITQDADAPNTKRKFYLGTSNYMAGRQAGKLVKEAAPDGGKVMIFVGVLDVLNAQERSLGVIDELMDKPVPAEYADQQ